MEQPGYGTRVADGTIKGPPREEDKAQKAPVTPRPVASINFSECCVHTVWNARPLNALETPMSRTTEVMVLPDLAQLRPHLNPQSSLSPSCSNRR